MSDQTDSARSFDALFKLPVTSASDQVIHSLIMSLAWFLAARAISRAKASAVRASSSAT
jgi:hypothetical protein